MINLVSSARSSPASNATRSTRLRIIGSTNAYCRFLLAEPAADLPTRMLTSLLHALDAAGARCMHLEKLQQFDGKPGYTKAQGEN